MEEFTAVQVSTMTATREEADRIAEVLVEARLAACVQVSGPVTSRYRWHGTVESAQEWLCLIKTTAGRFPEVEAAIVTAHSYEVPEILAVPVVAGSGAYLAWMASEVAAEPMAREARQRGTQPAQPRDTDTHDDHHA